MFTEGQKPLEVEILVAQLGNALRPTKLYRVAYEGTISDEPHFAVLGGDAETIKDRFALTEETVHSLETTLKNASLALTGPERTLSASELEVGILEDRGSRRTFARLTDEQVSELLS
jgi:proteasome alpha subunit